MIVLITPTGSRQTQINLCAKWMRAQTYKGPVAWLIIDDCIPVTTKTITADFRKNWTIIKAFPKPSWSRGMNTQRRNMDYAMELMMLNLDPKDIEAIFIIEDDDYYKPEYLDQMMRRMGNYYAIGEIKTVYYNVIYRTFFVNPNLAHASLFQTAFTLDALEYMKRSHVAKFIDAQFWKVCPNKYLFDAGKLSIGIKGIPGRGGIGAGHNMNYTMAKDPDMMYLKNTIGDDAQIYSRFFNGAFAGRRDLLTNRRPR